MPEATDFPTADAAAADLADAATGPISKGQSTGVLVAALLAAASNFVLMWLGLNTLHDQRQGKEFLIFWSLLTGMFGVVSGVQNETTRATGAVATGRPARGRMLVASVVAGAGVAAVLALLWPLLAARDLPLSSHAAMPLLLVGSVAYACYVTLVGGLAGHGRWSQYATLLCSEVVARMGLMVLVFVLGASLVGYELAAAGATAVLLVFLATSRSARAAFTARADVGLGPLLRQTGLAVTSTACTAVLVTAYPGLLQAANPHAGDVLVGSLVTGISLTRAPIMMPLTSFQSVAIRGFQEHRDAPLRALAKPSIALLALGSVGAALAWPVGVWFLPLFKHGYQLPGWVFSALTFSSALMAVLTIIGTLVLALDAHLPYVCGWLVAAVVSVAVLLLPWALDEKTVASLFLGPLAGITVLLGWLLARGRR